MEAFVDVGLGVGPLGDVAVNTNYTSALGEGASLVLYDPSGASTQGPTYQGRQQPVYTPLGVDWQGKLFYGFWNDPPPPNLSFVSSFTVGPVTRTASETFPAGGQCTGAVFELDAGAVMLARDQAGDSFVAVDVSSCTNPSTGYDFGGGAVSGAYLIEY